MKLLILSLLLASPSVFSQDVSGSDIYEEDPQVYREEGSPYSEVNPVYTEEVETPSLERQEEQYFNNAPLDQDWDLENDDLPAEDY